MFRIDKACDLSTFTDSDSSRYALGAICFKRPNPDTIAARFKELRKPTFPEPRKQSGFNKQTGKLEQRADRYGRKRSLKGTPPSVDIMPAHEAYRRAMSESRGTVEATDGRRLIVVPCLNGDEFPKTSGAGKEPSGDLLIPADFIKSVVKTIPRMKLKPVLESARLTMNGNDVVLSTTNIDRSTDQTSRQIDGRFPRTESVWPTAAPAHEITLDAKFLEDISKHARTFAHDGSIRLLIRDSESAVEFRYALSETEQREAKALIMPKARG